MTPNDERGWQNENTETQRAKSLRRKILKKISPDNFHSANQNSEDGKWEKEAHELTIELDKIWNDKSTSWQEKIDRLTEFEKNKVAEFLEKVKASKEADNNGNDIVGDNESHSKESDDMEGLMAEVDAARMRYAAADYKADEKKKWITRILGIGSENIKDKSVLEAYDKYQEKLSELAKSKISDNEVEEVIKYFDTEEKINLYTARTNARTEDWKNTGLGKFVSGVGSFVNWYRKQDAIAKGAVGVALAASGLGMAAAGMRVVSGAATGVGVTATLEAKQRAKEEKQAATKRAKFIEQLNAPETQNKTDKLMEILNGEMAEYHKNLSDEKNNARVRRLKGLGVGVFVGSGAMSLMFGEAFHKIGETDTWKTTADFWKEKIHNLFSSDVAVDSPANLRQSVAPEQTTDTAAVDSSGSIEQSVAPKQTADNITKKVLSSIFDAQPEQADVSLLSDTVKPDIINLEVTHGSSLEGTLIKQLKSMHSDWSDVEIGNQAHKMALQYAEYIKLENGPHSLIHPGAHIQLDSSGEHILDITDDKGLGYLRPRDIIVEQEYMQDILQSSEEIFSHHPELRGITEFDAKIDEITNDLQIQNALDQNIVWENLPIDSRPETKIEALEKLKDLRAEFIKTYKKLFTSLVGNMSEQQMSGDAGKYIADNGQSKITKLYNTIIASNHANAESVAPGSKETVSQWSERVIKFAVKHNVIKNK